MTANDKSAIWDAAIGLQKVDNLETSEYLKEVAERNIDGDFDVYEARGIIHSYYREKRLRADMAEADMVSANIAVVLSESGFNFSVYGIMGIHKRIFDGVFPFAGKPRPYNITKKEWVLDGESVIYSPCSEIVGALEYDIESERNVDYTSLSKTGIISRVSKFVSGIWQIHPFVEGNTRTVAVFTIKYLQKLGFTIDNAPFKENSWFFRNALVRANYQNIPAGIREDRKFLDMFFENMLYGANHKLSNREIHIKSEDDSPPTKP